MTPGFHVVPSAAYHADPCVAPSLSSSLAQVLLRESPRKAWFSHPRLNPKFREKHEDKFDLGTCAHAMLLENDPSKIAIVEANDWRTKAAQEQKAAARAAGKTPLLSKHYDEVRLMVDAALAFIAESEIADYWFNAEPELVGVWREGGTWLRCRFDKIAKASGVIMDYKTTDSTVEPEAFSRFLIRMGYHIQDAFYRRGAVKLGLSEPKFVFLAQSCEPPYECTLHGCHSALQEIADAEVERAVRIWTECMTRGKWPSYGGRIHWAMPTTYQMTEHEARLQEAA